MKNIRAVARTSARDAAEFVSLVLRLARREALKVSRKKRPTERLDVSCKVCGLESQVLCIDEDLIVVDVLRPCVEGKKHEWGRYPH